MKKIFLFLVRLLSILIYAVFILLVVGILSATLFYPGALETRMSRSVYAAIVIITCTFWIVVSRKDSLRLCHRDMRLVFSLGYDLFQNAAMALRNSRLAFSAAYPVDKNASCKESGEQFTYRTENICITFAEHQEDSLCEKMAEQLEPLFLYLKQIKEKMYELEDGDEVRVILKSYPDAGYQIQVLLDSRSKWTLFFIPSQDKGRIERNYFYRLKALGDSWYVGVRG